MNRDTVIALAREAGLVYFCVDGWTSPTPENKHAEGVDQEALERFAALVIANNPPQSWMSYQEGYEAGEQAGRLAEREECAKVCEELELRSADGQLGTYIAGWSDGTDDCATAIRSRT